MVRRSGLELLVFSLTQIMPCDGSTGKIKIRFLLFFLHLVMLYSSFIIRT